MQQVWKKWIKLVSTVNIPFHLVRSPEGRIRIQSDLWLKCSSTCCQAPLCPSHPTQTGFRQSPKLPGTVPVSSCRQAIQNEKWLFMPHRSHSLSLWLAVISVIYPSQENPGKGNAISTVQIDEASILWLGWDDFLLTPRENVEKEPNWNSDGEGRQRTTKVTCHNHETARETLDIKVR